MSADNWAQCPRCVEKFTHERQNLYGTVPEDKYLSEVERIEKAIAAQNLREDYEIGIDLEGNFYVHYRAHCAICDFNHEFNVDEKVWTSEEVK